MGLIDQGKLLIRHRYYGHYKSCPKVTWSLNNNTSGAVSEGTGKIGLHFIYLFCNVMLLCPVGNAMSTDDTSSLTANSLRVRCEFVSSSLLVHFKFVASSLRVRFEFGTNLQPVIARCCMSCALARPSNIQRLPIEKNCRLRVIVSLVFR